VSAGAALERIEQHPDPITVAAVNDAIYERSYDLTLIERLANLPEFSTVERALFEEHLEHVKGRHQTGTV